MRNKLVTALLFALFLVVSSAAHPLGNFSVNNFSRVNLEKSQINLHLVLEMAEIPTFQESQQIDVNKNGVLEPEELNAYAEKIARQYAPNLTLLLDARPLQIRNQSKNAVIQTGSGNLPILRIELDYVADAGLDLKDSVHRLRFENNNYKERVGWNEIVIGRAPDVSVFDSTAFGNSLSNELKSYPQDMLTAPLSERDAEFSFAAAPVAANVRPLQNRNGAVSPPTQKDKLAELISVPEITLPIVLIGLLIAFGLGAAHAMSPGHGKTVVGAYLVGSKGTIKHAAFLGLIVTVTHTLGVFALGAITLFAAQFILPERIMPFLGFISGLIVLFIGLRLFKERLYSALGRQTNEHLRHEHEFADGEDTFTHTHGGSTHSHLPPKSVTWRSLLALGVSGGLLPCPSALVLMLSAISFNRIAYGLLLTLAFSFGLAATLMGIGLAFLYFGKLLNRPSLENNRIVKALPVFSAFVIACLGAVICYNSIP